MLVYGMNVYFNEQKIFSTLFSTFYISSLHAISAHAFAIKVCHHLFISAFASLELLSVIRREQMIPLD